MQYIDSLVDQFVKANDIKSIDLNSKVFLEEFCKWIEKRQKLGENYKYLLKNMNLDITNSSTAEVGKTSFDSLCKDYDTTIITPYPYGYNTDNNLIVSNLSINKNGIWKLKNIKTIMMTNPYNTDDIKNWDKYHNNGGNIIVGIYGEYSDSDIHDKIQQLEEFKQLLNDNYIEEETNMFNTYCKVIASKRTTK